MCYVWNATLCMHLWYCAWRNWNSSFIRSRVSRTVNLKDWPGCKGTCTGKMKERMRWWLRWWHTDIWRAHVHAHVYACMCTWVCACVFSSRTETMHCVSIYMIRHMCHIWASVHVSLCVWLCVRACVCALGKGRKKSQDESEREGHFPFPHIIKLCPLSLFSSASNDSASIPPLPHPSLPFSPLPPFRISILFTLLDC